MTGTVDHTEFLRYCVQREVAKVQDGQKLLDVLSMLGVPVETMEGHCEAFLADAMRAERVDARKSVVFDGIDWHWVRLTIAAAERRGLYHQCKLARSGLNATAITSICMEWMAAVNRGVIK